MNAKDIIKHLYDVVEKADLKCDIKEHDNILFIEFVEDETGIFYKITEECCEIYKSKLVNLIENEILELKTSK